MSSNGDRQGGSGHSHLRFGVTAAWMFMTTAFVIPGVWGAVRGFPLPVPSSGYSWAGWILFWLGVSAGSSGIAHVVVRALTRRKAEN